MALTYTKTKDVESNGTGRVARGVLTFDSSYPTNGESYVASLFGLSIVESIEFNEQMSGYLFEHDLTNKKIKVYSGGNSGFTPAGTNANESTHTHAIGSLAASAPTFTGSALGNHNHVIQLRQDEVITVTAGTGVSSALANLQVANIQHVYITAGGVTGAAVQVPVGSVTNSKEFSANYTTGVLQFLVADAVTGAKVTYNDSTVSGESAGTPAGTNSAPSITGSTAAGAAHTHTFTGTAVVGAAASEVANTTNLSTLAVEVVVTGR